MASGAGAGAAGRAGTGAGGEAGAGAEAGFPFADCVPPPPAFDFATAPALPLAPALLPAGFGLAAGAAADTAAPL